MFNPFLAFALAPAGGFAPPWSPADLFAGGQPGHWPGGYDPAAGRMWQDVRGQSDVTTVDHPVGMVLDMSQTAADGPELLTAALSVSGVGGWAGQGGTPILTLTDGVFRIENGHANISRMYQQWSSEVGALYRINVTTIYGRSAMPGANSAGNPPDFARLPGYFFASTSTTFAVCYANPGLGGYSANRDWSARRILGHHANQSVALSRPTLGRWSKGGRRNLLTWTEGFTNPVWTPSGAVPSSGMLAEDNALSGHYMRQTLNPPFAVGVPGTASIEVKEGTSRYAQVCLTGGNRWRAVAIDLRTGATSSGQPATMSPMPPEVVTPLEDGWFRLSFSAAPLSSGTLSSLQVSVLPDLHETAPGTGGVVTYQGSGKNILVRNAQCELGTAATPYQRVTTANDITEAGVPAVYHLTNDGGDSLPLTLPAGTYGRAWVDAYGEITVDTVTDPTDALAAQGVGATQRDIILRQGAFSGAEEAAIRDWMAREYAA